MNNHFTEQIMSIIELNDNDFKIQITNKGQKTKFKDITEKQARQIGIVIDSPNYIDSLIDVICICTL